MRVVAPAVALAALLVAWQLVVVCGIVPDYLLPAPTSVVSALVTDAPLLADHAMVTLVEALIGLGAGLVLGMALATLMDRFLPVRAALAPIVTVSQTIPTIAIAPLLVLWLGYGILPKAVLVTLTTFFPVVVSLLEGFASVSDDQLDLMRTMGATRWQTYWHVKLPAALPHLMSGLKISATYAIVGAVISEWLGGNEGLGVYMTRVRKSFSYDRMFACVVVISALSLVLMRVIDLIRHLIMPWESPRERS